MATLRRRRSMVLISALVSSACNVGVIDATATTGPECNAHCANGMQDCGETGLDCGGECAACNDPCAGHCGNSTQDCGDG